MRMRKKKHSDERLSACASYLYSHEGEPMENPALPFGKDSSKIFLEISLWKLKSSEQLNVTTTISKSSSLKLVTSVLLAILVNPVLPPVTLVSVFIKRCLFLLNVLDMKHYMKKV